MFPTQPKWVAEAIYIASALKRYGAPPHLIAMEEFKHVAKSGGPDLTDIVDKLFSKKDVKTKKWETPNYLALEEINEDFSTLSMEELNSLLEDLGLQKNVKGEWKLTAKGKEITIKGGDGGTKWDYNQIRSMLDWKEVPWI